MSDTEITRRGPSPDEPTRKVGEIDAAGVAASLMPGALLGDGRYQIVGLLGTGGMSTVYDGFDYELERPVALKVLRDGEAAAALLDEAQMQAAVTISSVVGVYALHLDAQPPFLVLEHVDGVSLDRRLAETGLAWKHKWRVLRTVASALDHLHQRGITHGDVKAANVLVTRDGDAKLADFGVTRLLRQARPGDVVGTPTYMPPERSSGVPVEAALQPMGDVYSFAVLVYVVLGGRPPFLDATPDALMRAHASEPPPPLSAVSDTSSVFDGPLARALAKDPAARPRRAGELMAQLDAAARGLDAHGRPLRVLVVDDDDAHRELHVAVLRRSLAGATIESAANAADALVSVATHPPTVLVVDLAMPEVSGLVLAEQALRLAPTMSVAVVTGQGSGRERTAALALGVRHFLVKPVGADELTRCVLDCAEETRDLATGAATVEEKEHAIEEATT